MIIIKIFRQGILQFLSVLLGIVFDNLSTPDLEYTIRLRHDVGDGNSWFTRFNAPSFQLPGARVTNK